MRAEGGGEARITPDDYVGESHMPPLAVPPVIATNPDASEVARVWTDGEHQTFILDVSHYEDPAVWGLFALDLMKHAARAYQQFNGTPKEDAYRRILAGFMAEMQSPTEEL
jgi:hypothetical protein